VNVEGVLAAEPGAAGAAVAADDGGRLEFALRLVERRMILLKDKNIHEMVINFRNVDSYFV
jgi:hypothetical protein